MARKHSRLSGFARSERGSITSGGLILIVVFLAIGGIAVDVSNAYNQRTHLQLAADVAAHSALYDRNLLGADADSAKTSAIDLAFRNMPEDHYGEVLTEEDIEFGVWDGATRTFTPDEDSRTAVRVVTHRTEESENEISTLLLHFAGFDSWDVETVSVFETFEPPCLSEGFVAEELVDIQSNNSYFNGFCIHSNNVVSVNSNNYFEEGTIVSMPDTANLDLPASGFDSNLGLEQALRYGAMYLRIINALRTVRTTPWDTARADMWTFIQLASRDGQRDYITKNARRLTVVNGKPAASVSTDDTAEIGKDLKARDGTIALRANAVNYINCTNSTTQLGIDQTISNLVIITNCQIQFGADGALEDALIATTHTNDASISGPATTRIGKNDDCAAGGGAQLVTLGGIKFSSGVNVNGGQFIALKDIEFAANGDGLNGASFISGDTVSGTSNMNMGLCGTGMEDNLTLDYFRMVM